MDIVSFLSTFPSHNLTLLVLNDLELEIAAAQNNELAKLFWHEPRC